jgi:hypothetical protein
MPVYMLQTIYKEYTEFLKDEEKREAHASEEVLEEMADNMMP